MFQNIENKHKKEDDQQRNMGFFQVGCKQNEKQKEKKLKIDIKCMINQEVLVMKIKEQNEQMFDVKIEYSLFVDRKYLEQLPYFAQNYNQEEDLVQIVVLCSQGIKMPRDNDFHYFLECFDSLQEGKQNLKSLIQNKRSKTVYRLLICSIVLQHERMTDLIVHYITESLNMYSLFYLSVLCIQYESQQYAKYFYQLIIQYLEYHSGISNQTMANPHLQQVYLHIEQSNIKIPSKDVIEIFDGEKQLRVLQADLFQIASLFYKSMFKSIENKKKKYFQPLQKYQFYKNQRKKSQAYDNEGSYPHTYKLLDEAEGKQFLFAYQQSAHSEILIYEKEQIQYNKYSDDYLGCIERNFWGTIFQVYDYGYPKEAAQLFPMYFGVERKEMAQIQYQTNIMAAVPRKFTATMLNYVNMKEMKLVQLEPIYNEEKECYQLNFYGRARRASARNFEIIDPEDHNTIYLLHGKWEKNLFNLDYRFPMNMAQAFSFSLVSVSKKFLVQ